MQVLNEIISSRLNMLPQKLERCHYVITLVATIINDKVERRTHSSNIVYQRLISLVPNIDVVGVRLLDILFDVLIYIQCMDFYLVVVFTPHSK